MKNRRNYYRILHVQPDAPRAIIKASYRTLMQKLKLHPDLGGDEWDASVLNEAYATLSNSQRRAAYDQQILHRIKKTPPVDSNQPRAGKSNNRAAKKSKEYWKDLSLCPFCGTPKPARSDYSSKALDCSRCNSPLNTVVLLEITGQSQRKLERILNDNPVRIYTSPGDAAATPGTIRNLSPRGMQLTAAAKPENGQVIRIDSHILSATASVCYCKPDTNPGQHTIGVKFLTLRFHAQLGTFFSGSA